MDSEALTRLAGALVRGEIGAPELLRELAQASVADLGSAQVDLDRARRCGFPEVVYGPGKPVQTLESIARALLDAGQEVLATRITPEQAAGLSQRLPALRYNSLARTIRISPEPPSPPGPAGRVVIATAGTSDLPVAEEARETAEWMGAQVTIILDVGVAGPQRLLARLREFAGADAVVVAAGMEGALPSVVAGHVSCPVIAVPTSVGYGTSLGGVAALLAMLNSCAANVAVVNIDAGFKAGFMAGLIAHGAASARAIPSASPAGGSRTV
jgi:hypothetical protein